MTELGYAETTADSTSNSTTVGNDAWTGLSVTVTVGTNPILVRAWCAGASSNTGGDGGTMSIYEGATKKTSTSFTGSGVSEVNGGIVLECRLSPAAGSYTYSVKINAVAGGLVTFSAGSSSHSFFGPAFIQVLEI